MEHEMFTVGSVEDPARCTGWSTQRLPTGMMTITVNDNGKVVILTMSVATIHGMVCSLISMAKTHAPLHIGSECPVCERGLDE